MFLIDPRDLSVHEVDPERLTVANGVSVLAPSRATASFKCVFIHGRFPGCTVKHESLVFLKLRNGHGWVWASSISVVNDGKFPVDAPTLGDGFFFVWPVPVAINAFFEINEKRRLRMGTTSTFDEVVMDHPPCISYVPGKDGLPGTLSLPTVRKLAVDQLTAAQRLFVASLVPHATPFAMRNHADKWCDRLGQRDQAQFEAWRATVGMPFAKPAPCPRGAGERSGARAAECAKQRDGRVASSCPLLDLPDDLLERIVGAHLIECLWDTDLLQVKVRMCAVTSVQFERATRSAAYRILDRVVDVSQSLLTDRPRGPLEVQSVVHAACLTLRHALMLHRGDWATYIRFRRRSLVWGYSMTSEQRRHFLWCDAQSSGEVFVL